MNRVGIRASCLQYCLHLVSWLAFSLAATPVDATETSIVQSLTATVEQVTLSLSTPAAVQRATLPADPERGLPHRCYVNITPATLSDQVHPLHKVDTPGVQRIRVSQFRADTVRVVLDLAAAQACSVSALTAPDRLQITVDAESASASSPPAPLVPRSPAPQPQRTAALSSGANPAFASPHRAESSSSPQVRTTLPPQQVAQTPSPQLSQPIPTTPAPASADATAPGHTISLEEAYQAALANEEQLKVAGRELAKAQLLPWRAITQLTPRADITGLYTRNKEELAFQFPEGLGGAAASGSAIRPLEIWQGVFGVTQPILQPSFFPSRQLGKDAVRQGEQQYDFTVREVLFGVAQAYYDVLRIEAQITVAQETLLLTQDQLKQARVRVRVGEVTETDALRAEVDVAQAEQTLITAQHNRRLTTTVLARAIGEQRPLQVVEPTPPPYPVESYEELLNKAYQQRQDLRAREFAVDMARQRKNLVLARYAPQVDTQWQFNRRDTETFAERDKFWTLFLNFRVPLFDGGVRELDLMEQEENLGQAQLQVDRLRKDISVEVRQALVSLETLGATLETLKKQVVLAQRNYDITSKQYGVGEATSLDINNTLNTLNLVRTRLIDQTYAYQLAILNLERVMGSFAQDYVPQR